MGTVSVDFGSINIDCKVSYVLLTRWIEDSAIDMVVDYRTDITKSQMDDYLSKALEYLSSLQKNYCHDKQIFLNINQKFLEFAHIIINIEWSDYTKYSLTNDDIRQFVRYYQHITPKMVLDVNDPPFGNILPYDVQDIILEFNNKQHIIDYVVNIFSPLLEYMYSKMNDAREYQINGQYYLHADQEEDPTADPDELNELDDLDYPDYPDDQVY